VNRPVTETLQPAGPEGLPRANRVVHHAPAAPAPARPRILVLYVIEGITSHSVALMLASIYFYTTGRFGWGSTRNYLLAATLGVIYVLGALSAHAVAVRLGRRATLVTVYLLMSAAAWAAVVAHDSPHFLVPLLLLYSGLSAISWPALESLVSSGAAAGELSRRLGVYNCVWAGAGTITVALAGTLLKYWPTGTFAIPGFWHAMMPLLLLGVLARDRSAGAEPDNSNDGANPADAHAHALAPEPELLRVRTLALWMSRLALPATFVVISSLLAAMPTLPLIEQLDPTARTVAGSVWMAARWVAFLLLGATVWWHTRPRALLTAALLLLAGFLAVMLRPQWLPGLPEPGVATWLAWMIFWQVVLGLALGLIYAASLYFGMVLSDGSTEHGGYHEALIGVGNVLGPGAGALAQHLGAGNPLWGVLAVSLVLAISIAACAVVAARRTDPRGTPRPDS
jgi:MFS family permease